MHKSDDLIFRSGKVGDSGVRWNGSNEDEVLNFMPEDYQILKPFGSTHLILYSLSNHKAGRDLPRQTTIELHDLILRGRNDTIEILRSF